jgi:hypothetical protein
MRVRASGSSSTIIARKDFMMVHPKKVSLAQQLFLSRVDLKVQIEIDHHTIFPNGFLYLKDQALL